jgi:hypothetical protein
MPPVAFRKPVGPCGVPTPSLGIFSVVRQNRDRGCNPLE